MSLRERTRAAYIWVARTLADDSVAAGDPATAVRCYLRVLEHDPYDEHASLGLVRAHLGAGQQGEARRAYQAYGARMGEIGVEAAPFPATGGPGARPRVEAEPKVARRRIGTLPGVETFVVRAWREDPDDEPTTDDSLRGVVEHVATGASTPFRDAEQLLLFLRSRPGAGGRPDG